MRAVLVLATAFVLLSSGCTVPQDGEGQGREAKRVGGVSPASVPVFPGAYKFDGRFSQVLAPGLYKVLEHEDVVLKSKLDGKDIDLVNWRPDVPEGMKVPVIIQASPYYSDTSVLSGIGLFITTNFVPHGYVYSQLAVRSTGDSGGCDDFRGPKMTADMSQAIDWLAEQPWSNGNVTLIGISYVGTTPWYAAGSGNPHIKTIVPISGSTDAWMVYNRNGSSESRSVSIIPGYGSSAATNPNRSPQHKVENFTCTEADVYKAWAAGIYGGIMGDKEPFRDFWDARNVKPIVEKNYKGSIFVIHGFEDWNVDPAIVFPWSNHLNRSLGLHVKTLVGQWLHSYPDTNGNYQPPGFARGDTNRWDWAEILLHWFDYWLKGQTQVDLGPAVQLQDNQMKWRNEEHYPPDDAAWSTLHLGANGALLEQPGTAGSIRLVPTAADPGVVRSLPGGVAYISTDFKLPPLEQDLRISGLPRAHVTVTPQGPGGYIAAWLMDIDPAKGTERRIGWTSMNLRFHEGGDQAKTVTPGQPIVAKMEIQPMDALVPAGHVLALRVWVNGHSDRVPSIPPTVVDVNYGGTAKSTLELPIIERGPELFFQPPMPVK